MMQKADDEKTRALVNNYFKEKINRVIYCYN